MPKLSKKTPLDLSGVRIKEKKQEGENAFVPSLHKTVKFAKAWIVEVETISVGSGAPMHEYSLQPSTRRPKPKRPYVNPFRPRMSS